jgi:hypothetical protein
MIYKTNTTQKTTDRATRFMKEAAVKINFRTFDCVIVMYFILRISFTSCLLFTYYKW